MHLVHKTENYKSRKIFAKIQIFCAVQELFAIMKRNLAFVCFFMALILPDVQAFFVLGPIGRKYKPTRRIDSKVRL